MIAYLGAVRCRVDVLQVCEDEVLFWIYSSRVFCKKIARVLTEGSFENLIVVRDERNFQVTGKGRVGSVVHCKIIK